MKKVTLTVSAIALYVLMACTGSSEQESKDANSTEATESAKQVETTKVDLTDKGIPVILKVPAGHKVRDGIGMAEMDGVKYLNYEVVKDQFILSVSMAQEDMYQAADAYYQEAIELAKMNEGFVEIIKEEPNGFIYKLKNDDGDDYNFYYLLVKNNRAMEFEAGLSMFSNFSRDDVDRLYAAAKAAK